MNGSRRTIARIAMTGFGLGYAPVASGTFGSAGAVAIGLVVWSMWATDSRLQLDAIWIGLAAAASLGCIAWGPWAVAHYAGRCRKLGDPGQVVIDEFAGQWVALIALPMPGHANWKMALAIFAAQFLLFRLFDVLKLSPARQVERLPAGWGILMDDIVAGVHANVVGQILFRCIIHG